MKRWHWIAATIVTLLVLGGAVYAMRWNIGASQVSRIDVGEAQESETTINVNNWWWRRRH